MSKKTQAGRTPAADADTTSAAIYAADTSFAESRRSGALERVADALYFLHNIQPLEGCDYADDEQFACGRAAILQLIEEEVRRRSYPAELADDAAAKTATRRTNGAEEVAHA